MEHTSVAIHPPRSLARGLCGPVLQMRKPRSGEAAQAPAAGPDPLSCPSPHRNPTRGERPAGGPSAGPTCTCSPKDICFLDWGPRTLRQG